MSLTSERRPCVTESETMTENPSIFRMPAGSFGREIMRRFAPWWIWGGVALFIVGIVAAFAMGDVRWAIVGLMVLLIMLPMALAICYYNHALCRECFVNVLPHAVHILDGDIVVTLYEKPEEDTEEVAGEYHELRQERFGADCVTGWSVRDKVGYVELRDRMTGFIWVPMDIDNFEEIANFARNSGGASIATPENVE